MTELRGFSRRAFLGGLGAAPFVLPFLSPFEKMAAAERKRVKVRDLQVMLLQGPSRTYTLVKVTADAGPYGIAEAYGSPAVGVKEQVLSLKPWPTPRNMLDKTAVADWAAKARSHPGGFTCHKFGFPNSDPATDNARDVSNRVLTTTELIAVQKGFENCRDAIGWDHDLMVHCHWEYDLRTAIQIADAVEPVKPVWLEDPLPVDYSDSWKRLCAASKVPICMGENLTRREGFKDFIVNQGCDILHPDLRNSGGFLETKRIADMAHVFGLPMANHNTGSQVCTYASAQWASSIRDYISLETITGEGGWMDQVLLLEGPYIKDGFIQVTEKPGLGIELNPDIVRAHLAPGESWWS